MAKRRTLKKIISNIADEFLTEVFVCKLFIHGAKDYDAEPLICKICDMRDNFMRRAHQPDGKNNKKLVKQHYRKLFADLNMEVESIGKEVTELSKKEK